jgi:small basic protein
MGANKRFMSTAKFLTVILAAILVFIGELLSLDLYIAAIVVFGSRLFNNFAKIRRILLNSYKKEDNI